MKKNQLKQKKHAPSRPLQDAFQETKTVQIKDVNPEKLGPAVKFQAIESISMSKSISKPSIGTGAFKPSSTAFRPATSQTTRSTTTSSTRSTQPKRNIASSTDSAPALPRSQPIDSSSTFAPSTTTVPSSVATSPSSTATTPSTGSSGMTPEQLAEQRRLAAAQAAIEAGRVSTSAAASAVRAAQDAARRSLSIPGR